MDSSCKKAFFPEGLFLQPGVLKVAVLTFNSLPE